MTLPDGCVTTFSSRHLHLLTHHFQCTHWIQFPASFGLVRCQQPRINLALNTSDPSRMPVPLLCLSQPHQMKQLPHNSCGRQGNAADLPPDVLYTATHNQRIWFFLSTSVSDVEGLGNYSWNYSTFPGQSYVCLLWIQTSRWLLNNGHLVGPTNKRKTCFPTHSWWTTPKAPPLVLSPNREFLLGSVQRFRWAKKQRWWRYDGRPFMGLVCLICYNSSLSFWHYFWGTDIACVFRTVLEWNPTT